MPIKHNKVSIRLPNELEHLYRIHSSMIYGISLEVSATQEEAEELFIETFVQMHNQIPTQSGSRLCVAVVKLVMQIAQAKLGATGFKGLVGLKHFEQLPLINHLLRRQVSVSSLCKENKLTKALIGKKLRQEFLWLRNVNNQRGIMWVEPD